MPSYMVLKTCPGHSKKFELVTTNVFRNREEALDGLKQYISSSLCTNDATYLVVDVNAYYKSVVTVELQEMDSPEDPVSEVEDKQLTLFPEPTEDTHKPVKTPENASVKSW